MWHPKVSFLIGKSLIYQFFLKSVFYILRLSYKLTQHVQLFHFFNQMLTLFMLLIKGYILKIIFFISSRLWVGKPCFETKSIKIVAFYYHIQPTLQVNFCDQPHTSKLRTAEKGGEHDVCLQIRVGFKTCLNPKMIPLKICETKSKRKVWWFHPHSWGQNLLISEKEKKNKEKK